MERQFYGVIERASNIGRQEGGYTAAMFQADFPQFYTSEGVCLIPETVLNEFVSLTNATIQPDKWLESWRYGAGLFLAHNATMYLRSYREFSATPQEAADSGQVIGIVQSASLGDASVSYSDGTQTMATQGWGDLNATQYGQLLATKARFIGMGGSYVL